MTTHRCKTETKPTYLDPRHGASQNYPWYIRTIWGQAHNVGRCSDGKLLPGDRQDNLQSGMAVRDVMGIVGRESRSYHKPQTISFEGLPPERRLDVMLKMNGTNNGKISWMCQPINLGRPVCMQVMFKHAVSLPVLEKVNKVDQVETFAIQEWQKKHFWTVVSCLRWNVIQNGAVILNFLLLTFKGNISLEAHTTRYRYTQTLQGSHVLTQAQTTVARVVLFLS